MRKCSFPRCTCKATGLYCAEYKAKKQPKGLKRTPIAKISAKGKVKKKLKMALVQTDMAFYIEEIWLKRAHSCQITKEYMSEPLLQCFHHILEKEPYPEYRHKAWNILLVSWLTHDRIHRNISVIPVVEKLTKWLKKLHDTNKILEDDGVMELLVNQKLLTLQKLNK